MLQLGRCRRIARCPAGRIRGPALVIGRAVLAAVMAAVPVASAPLVYAQRPAVPPALVFDAVTVVDVAQGQLIPHQRVVVVGTRIHAVGESRTVPIPPGAQVVEAGGRYLIPGLWDLHVHPGRAAVDYADPLLLVNGVTGIRNPGSSVPLDTLRQWRRDVLLGRGRFLVDRRSTRSATIPVGSRRQARDGRCRDPHIFVWIPVQMTPDIWSTRSRRRAQT